MTRQNFLQCNLYPLPLIFIWVLVKWSSWKDCVFFQWSNQGNEDRCITSITFQKVFLLFVQLMYKCERRKCFQFSALMHFSMLLRDSVKVTLGALVIENLKDSSQNQKGYKKIHVFTISECSELKKVMWLFALWMVEPAGSFSVVIA